MKFLLLALLALLVSAPFLEVEAQPTVFGWQRVHGVIEQIEGSTMIVRDEGDRAGQAVRVRVDVLPTRVRENLNVGDRVDVRGLSEPGRIVARYVDHDSRPLALPREALPISP